jgi:hypothetical protein
LRLCKSQKIGASKELLESSPKLPRVREAAIGTKNHQIGL